MRTAGRAAAAMRMPQARGRAALAGGGLADGGRPGPLPLPRSPPRSMQMSQWLIQQGFKRVSNVTGGIDAYSMAVDPSVPQY